MKGNTTGWYRDFRYPGTGILKSMKYKIDRINPWNTKPRYSISRKSRFLNGGIEVFESRGFQNLDSGHEGEYNGMISRFPDPRLCGYRDFGDVRDLGIPWILGSRSRDIDIGIRRSLKYRSFKSRWVASVNSLAPVDSVDSADAIDPVHFIARVLFYCYSLFHSRRTFACGATFWDPEFDFLSRYACDTIFFEID